MSKESHGNSASTSGALPRWLLAAYGVSAVFATVGGIFAYPWLAGAAISGTLAAAFAHRRVWGWPPDPIGWTVVAVATLAGAAGAIALSQTRYWPHSAPDPNGPSARQSSTATAPMTATTAPIGNGQIDGGNHNYAVSNTTDGAPFRNTARAEPCDVLTYRLKVYNPGPDPVTHVAIAMSLNTITPYRKWVSTAVAHTPDGINGMVAFQSKVRISAARTQRYMPGTTALMNSAGHVVATSANGQLSDAITATARGIDIGRVDRGVTMFVLMRSKVACDAPSYK